MPVDVRPPRSDDPPGGSYDLDLLTGSRIAVTRSCGHSLRGHSDFDGSRGRRCGRGQRVTLPPNEAGPRRPFDRVRARAETRHPPLRPAQVEGGTDEGRGDDEADTARGSPPLSRCCLPHPSALTVFLVKPHHGRLLHSHYCYPHASSYRLFVCNILVIATGCLDCYMCNANLAVLG